jgi:hypothetical protein
LQRFRFAIRKFVLYHKGARGVRKFHLLRVSIRCSLIEPLLERFPFPPPRDLLELPTKRRRSPRQATPNVPPIMDPPPHPTCHLNPGPVLLIFRFAPVGISEIVFLSNFRTPHNKNPSERHPTCQPQPRSGIADIPVCTGRNYRKSYSPNYVYFPTDTSNTVRRHSTAAGMFVGL